MSFVKRISSSQLVRGSLFVFIASNIANFGNFIYNLSMGRLLGPKYYADLGAVFSLLVVIGVPLSILNLWMVKIASSYWGKKDMPAIRSLFIFFTPRLFMLGIGICLMIVFAAPSLTNFLKLDNLLPLFVISIIFIFNIPTILNRAILQGMLAFHYLAFNSFIEILSKIIISISLVTLGYQLLGALIGPLIALILVYFITVVELRAILPENTGRFSFSLNKLLRPAVPILFSSLSLNILVNADIILVRHFFPAAEAGQYVALSTAAKIIFYAISPVISVMFPLVNSRVESKKPFLLPLLGTLSLSLGLGMFLVVIYFIFPREIVAVLFGSIYYDIIPYLGIFGFYITLYTVNVILTYLMLSISCNRQIFYLFIMSLLQTPLIILFHQTFLHVIVVNISVCFIYLCAALFFIWRKENINLHKILPLIFRRGVYGI